MSRTDRTFRGARRAVLALTLGLTVPAIALGAPPRKSGRARAPEPLRPEVEAFAGEVAARHGLDPDFVRRVLEDAKPQPSIIRAMSAPSTARPWHEYHPAFLNGVRVAGGVRFWARHAEILARARSTYGVPEEMIVATIGVETIYGQAMGTFRVLDALATLAFDYAPRAEFFRGELEQFLRLSAERRLDWRSVRGSYAGAMGMPQFLPSSFRRYAVDFDGDGRVEFWRGAADAIGSVANYYREFGWRTDAPVVVRAEAKGDAYRSLVALGIKPQIPLADLPVAGVLLPAASVGDDPVCVIELAEVDAPAVWVGFNNFYVITRYNRSTNYAMSVYLLAEAIRAARSGGDPGR